MPGIYINDGGGLQQSLGNILGGIATNLGPQAAAEAQNLKYRTEAQDIANQKASEALQALENATNQGGGALGQANAAPGSVPGTAAALAAPPTLPPLVGGLRHPAGTVLSTNPYVAQVQNWIQSGQATPDAWKNDIVPLGQTMTTGPGSDYTTQTEVVKAREMPVTVSSGTTRIQDPTKPATGSNVIQGPSTYETTASDAAAKADQDEARNNSSVGAASATNLANLQQLNQLYDAVVAPGANVPGLAQELAVRKLAEATGIDLTRFSSVEDAKMEIKGRLAGMLGSARQAQGNPALRGGFNSILQTLPNADMSPERYHSMSDAFAASLKRQIADGQAADAFLKTPSPDTATARRTALAQNRAAEAAELAAHGYKVDAGNPPDGSAPAPPAPAPAGPTLRPATDQELVFARQAIAAGQSKADVIAHARQKNIDLGPNF